MFLCQQGKLVSISLSADVKQLVFNCLISHKNCSLRDIMSKKKTRRRKNVKNRVSQAVDTRGLAVFFILLIELKIHKLALKLANFLSAVTKKILQFPASLALTQCIFWQCHSNWYCGIWITQKALQSPRRVEQKETSECCRKGDVKERLILIRLSQEALGHVTSCAIMVKGFS